MERDNVNARHYTTAAALGTVMGKVFGLRSPHSSALLDRCPTFVSKDKSLKAKLIGKTRKVRKITVISIGLFTFNPLTFYRLYSTVFGVVRLAVRTLARW